MSASSSSSSSHTAIENGYEYEYSYSVHSADKDETSDSDVFAPSPRTPKGPSGFTQHLSSDFGKMPPKQLGKLRASFGKARSLSTTDRPKNFMPPAITDLSTSDLPPIPPGKRSRFNPKLHKNIWFIIDTTSFEKNRSSISLLKLLTLFRYLETQTIVVKAILFYDSSVIDPYSYENTDDTVSEKIHQAFGGLPHTFPLMTKRNVRKQIQRYVRDRGSENFHNVEYRTLNRSSQNVGGRIALWGAVAHEILSERTPSLELPNTLLIFASQTDPSIHIISDQGMDYVRSMHQEGMIWTVRAFTEISMLHSELVVLEDGSSGSKSPALRQ